MTGSVDSLQLYAIIYSMWLEKCYPIVFLEACGRIGDHFVDAVIDEGIKDKILAKLLNEK